MSGKGQPTLFFRVHAVRQMFLRGVTEIDVRIALESGEVIESNPEGDPFPSKVYLAWLGEGPGRRPLHVVASFDVDASTM